MLRNRLVSQAKILLGSPRKTDLPLGEASHARLHEYGLECTFAAWIRETHCARRQGSVAGQFCN